ncbi:MAG: hypothetical protein HY961_21210 [Ignavibacteriae bacterium]|nr:hypothetical protein [Ignavibacteriota bacterium]
MKTETIHAVEMVRQIRDKHATLYWTDKAAYLKQMQEAANKMKALLSKQRAHGS